MSADRLAAAPLARQAATLTADGTTFDLTPVVLENTSSGSASTTWSPSAARHPELRGDTPEQGIPLIAIPKTMDNDVQGTEYCIGFSTAITRAKELINRQRHDARLARADRQSSVSSGATAASARSTRVRDLRAVA